MSRSETEPLLQAMRAAAEPTRLRILLLCAHGELTVSELMKLLGQGQSRVSRHLKLMVDAGLLERHQEGSWARFRLASAYSQASANHDPARANIITRYAETIIDLVPLDDEIPSRDLRALEKLHTQRNRRVSEYFTQNAPEWDKIRILHVDESQVNKALKDIISKRNIERFLDIGTGTGQILELIGPHVKDGIGIDLSADMLEIARAGLERAGLRHCQVRQADMYQLPFDDNSFDAITLHMVLHYTASPAAVLAEAGRVLDYKGTLLVADFAEHNLIELQSKHQHQWPGFGDAQMQNWLKNAGLSAAPVRDLKGGPLTVSIWRAAKAKASKAA